MTIVEELDKKSKRPHRSKNIVDAMKYAYNIEKTPKNIMEAIKVASSGPSPTPTTDNIVGTAKVGEAQAG